MTDKTETKQDRSHLFPPGVSGNPKGRPKGARSKLGEAFISALHSDFTEHGVAAIEKVRDERPHEYLKVVASILPKELNIKVEDELSDAELDERIRQLASALSLEIGIGVAVEGEEVADRSQSTGEIPSLH